MGNNRIENHFNEIKQLGRQVKRQLLDDEDIISLGNKIFPTITTQLPPLPTVRKNKAISLDSSSCNSLDNVVVKQGKQLFNSFNKLKQVKQTLEFSPSSETNASPSSIPDLKETKYTEVIVTQTTLSFPP